MRPIALVLVFAVSACSETKPQPQASAASEPAKATITITSKSPEAIEHLKKGEALMVNVRAAEAAAEFAQALTLDPDFVLAHALHGQTIPGPEGLKEVGAAASALPVCRRQSAHWSRGCSRPEPGSSKRRAKPIRA